MSKYPLTVERKWKRPVDIAPFPNVWNRFAVKAPNGHMCSVRIEDLMPDRYDEVWDMYEKYFFTEEDLVKSANEIDDKVTMASQKWAYDQCVKTNMSLIAVLDNEDSKPTILGGLTLSVVSRNDAPFPTLPGEARAKVHNLFKLLDKDVNAFEKLKIDRHFKDHGLVVKPEYQRMGIASQLFKTMEPMAKTFGIPAAVIIFNNASSQALGRKLGYSVLNEVELSDYVDESGKMILQPVRTTVVQLAYRKFL